MFKKRLITTSVLSFATALLLGSSLIISNKPEKVSAINDTHEHDDWTGVNELPTEAGDYYLTDNITLSATWNVPVGTTNLCLNGYIINANDVNFSVITIPSGATLNLYDCGNTSHNGYVDSNGLWHLGEGEGTAKTITGGIITGGYFPNTSGSGGGVNVGKGEFNMYGGTIAGNKAGANGGGLFIGTGGKFTMSAGGIIFNKANAGGGVASQTGTIEINSGMITDNNATNGGGLFNFNGSTTITGGSICNNFATTNGGGVYLYGNSVFGGTAQITGNKLSGISNNVFLPNGKTITLGTDENAPTTMSVGITTQNAPTETAPVKITADGVADYSANFFSDNQNYCINYNTKKENYEYLELVEISALDVWANTYLHLDQTENNGYCKDATHQWYKIAKTNLITLGNETITKLQTSTDAKVTSYRERYEAWARANGDYEHCYEDYFSFFGSNNGKTVTINNNVTLIVLISLVSISTIGVYFLLRRKTNILKK